MGNRCQVDTILGHVDAWHGLEFTPVGVMQPWLKEKKEIMQACESFEKKCFGNLFSTATR